jgi:hypothetical protein
LDAAAVRFSHAAKHPSSSPAHTASQLKVPLHESGSSAAQPEAPLRRDDSPSRPSLVPVPCAVLEHPARLTIETSTAVPGMRFMA